MGLWEKIEKRFTVISGAVDGMQKDMDEEMDSMMKEVPLEKLPDGVIEKETTVTERKPDGTVVTTKTVIRTRKGP